MKTTHSATSQLLLRIVCFCLCLLPAATAKADTAIIEGLTAMRQSVSLGFKEVYYDTVQYEISSTGGYRYVQSVSGLYFNDGGKYGSAAAKQLYAAKVEWLNWANGKWYIDQNHLKSWIPTASAKFWPFNSINDGVFYYEVVESSAGGGGNGGGSNGGGGVISKLVDRKLLREIAGAVFANRGKPLSDFNWASLKRLSGNQIRSLFDSLGREAAAVTENPDIAGQLSELGNQMGTLLEQQLELRTSPLSAKYKKVGKLLRSQADKKRKLSYEIAKIYNQMFDSPVRQGMRRQLNGFVIDYENTLRSVEGNWTLQTPRWRYVSSFDITVFSDLRGPRGNPIYFDDAKFPFVRVFTEYPLTSVILGEVPGEQWVYFLPKWGFASVPSDQFPELRDGITLAAIDSMRSDSPSPNGVWPSSRPRQVFRISATGKWYAMTQVTNASGARVSKCLEYLPASRTWFPARNPFDWRGN